MDGSSKVHAVADSTSAAAGTESAKMAAANSSQIKLLIKSSNQQFDDHIIESDLQWTVKRLKTQLSLVYPGNPPVTDQKLIYSGKLLKDDAILKEVIRSYNNILHLVCVSKTGANMSTADKTKTTTTATTANAMPTSTMATSAAAAAASSATASSSNILRQRRPALISIGSALITPAAGTASSQHTPYVPNNQQANFQAYVAMQQMAMYQNWMQNVYAQYMDQCMRFNPHAAEGLPNNAAAPPMPTHFQLPQAPAAALFPGIPPQFVPAYAGDPAAAGQMYNAATAANPVIPLANSETAATAATPVAASAAVDEPQPAAGTAAPPAPAAAPAGAAAAPRFPLMAAAAAQDDNEPIDWLETFFSFSRFVLFSLVVVFNASPFRFFIVMVVAALISLYRRRVVQNLVNGNNNAGNEANQIQQGVRQVREQQHDNAEEQQPLNEEPHETSAETESSAEQAEPDQVSTLAFVRTFVVSFFTSLLPEPTAL